MKQLLYILITLILPFSNISFGQNHKLVSEIEQALINDLSSTFRDTSISFVISPLITNTISSSDIDIPRIVSKYGFSKEKLVEKSIDTLLIKNNTYFKIIDQDSLLKYNNLEFDAELCIQKGIDPFQHPILYYIEKKYNKSGICYFYKPVFSKDRSYAIIEYWVYCGFLCGWGELVLMKKIEDKWSIIETLIFSES